MNFMDSPQPSYFHDFVTDGAAISLVVAGKSGSFWIPWDKLGGYPNVLFGRVVAARK